MPDGLIHETIKGVGALILLWNAVNGVRGGAASLFYRNISRAVDGELFWAAVVLSGILGTVLAIATIFPAFENL